MVLEAYAVDLGAVRLHELDDILGGGGLDACVFEVVVVVIEFGVGVGNCCRGEGNGDVCGADVLIEDAVAVAAVFVEGYTENLGRWLVGVDVFFAWYSPSLTTSQA